MSPVPDAVSLVVTIRLKYIYCYCTVLGVLNTFKSSKFTGARTTIIRELENQDCLVLVFV